MKHLESELVRDDPLMAVLGERVRSSTLEMWGAPHFNHL